METSTVSIVELKTMYPMQKLLKHLGFQYMKYMIFKKKLQLECELIEMELCPSCTSTRIHKQKHTQKFRCEKCKNVFQKAVIKKVPVINYDYPMILLPYIEMDINWLLITLFLINHPRELFRAPINFGSSLFCVGRK
jgi:ribosomal protein L37AE/L43A